MNSIDMRAYYKGCVVMCQIFLDNTISAYLDGLKTLQEESEKKRDISATMAQVKTVYSGIPDLGQHLANSLRLWQEQGGTFKELCELCEVNHKKYNFVPSRMDFVEVMRKHQLDFVDAGKRPVSWQDNAPLTLGILAADDITKIHVGKQDIA